MSTTYDEFDPQFKCCTLCDCNVVTGTKVFLTLFTIGAVCDIILMSPWGLIYLLFFGIIFVCTIAAFHTRDPKLLWPFIIVSVIEFLVALLVLACFITIVIIDGNAERIDYSDESIIFIFCLRLIDLLVSLWQYNVVLKCKRFYELKKLDAHFICDPFNDPLGQKV